MNCIWCLIHFLLFLIQLFGIQLNYWATNHQSQGQIDSRSWSMSSPSFSSRRTCQQARKSLASYNPRLAICRCMCCLYFFLLQLLHPLTHSSSLCAQKVHKQTANKQNEHFFLSLPTFALPTTHFPSHSVAFARSFSLSVLISLSTKNPFWPVHSPITVLSNPRIEERAARISVLIGQDSRS